MPGARNPSTNRITHDTKRATNTPISISSVNLAKHKKEPLLLTDISANDCQGSPTTDAGATPTFCGPQPCIQIKL